MTRKQCSDCQRPADWTRCTQFAGDHDFCVFHALKQADFGRDDSNAFWTRTKR